jgi:RNA polymerase sigma-70 factor, ECF subfamily
MSAEPQSTGNLAPGQVPLASSEVPSTPGEIRAWFESIVAKNYRLLFAVAYRRLGNVQDAEDAVQSSVLKGLAQLDKLKTPGTVVGWLATITRHTCLDMRKRGGSTKIGQLPEDLDLPADPPRSTGAGALAPQDCQALREVVNELPDNLSIVITLRHLEGLQVAEIAARLGLTPNAAGVRLFRAYARLRTHPRVRELFGWES